MKILAFDTSSIACSVALLSQDAAGNESIRVAHEIAPKQQAKQLLPTIERLLAEQSLTLTDLDAIAYGSGPGSFTGIRIASSVAQGLSFTAKCPLIAISSLAAMAQAAYLDKPNQDFLVAVDARQSEIYWAHYHVNDHSGLVELVGDERAIKPNEGSCIYPHKTIGIGDGWGKYQHELLAAINGQLLSINIDQQPTAQALLYLAREKYQKRDFITINDAIPVYLR